MYEPFLRELKRWNDTSAAVFAAGKKQHRSRQFPDIPQRYAKAVDALRGRGARLTKQAIATEMGVDRKTLRRYIEDYNLPDPPQ
jgi:hypothetical protein